MSAEDDERAWHHCNICGGSKKHSVLYRKQNRWNQDIGDDFSISGEDEYTLFQCGGCENVSFQRRSWNSEDVDPRGMPEVSTRNYPPQSSREPPSWLSDLVFVTDFDDSIDDLVREIYVALQNDAPRLAVMGIRALLEKIMIDKVGDQGSFGKTINAFEGNGFISRKQRDVLEQVLEAGHATMHRAYKPKRREVAVLMDITESIIESTYLNEFRAKGLLDKVPPRPGKVEADKKDG